MKFSSMVMSLALLFLGRNAQGCKVSKDVNGINSVVFSLYPTPEQSINSAGLSNSKSPLAIMVMLDGFGVKAQEIIRGLGTLSSGLANNNPFGSKGPSPKCRYYSVANQIFCDNVNSEIITPICAAFDVIKNVTMPIRFPLPTSPYIRQSCENDTTYPWGIKTIHGPECWQQGYNGKGIVVANIDTGVRATHEELKGNRRAEYYWYNAYNPKNTTPHDTVGHGTHTMGSMVGKTVGIAPGATWLACMGCNAAGCDNEQLIACGQFMACPDRKEKNCTTIPDVINNSWGGGIGNTMYQGVLATWKALGIKSFFATGNSGPLCSTIASPADGNWTKWGIMSVGATACNENIAFYSSNGPSQAADYLLGLGVAIVGPGSNVRSAWNLNDTSYNVISGTSMSSPYVAGVAAVLMSKNRNMTAQKIYDVMKEGAYRNSEINSPLCGGKDLLQTAPWPNNVYGYGRVDCAGSIKLVQKI